MYSNSKFKKGDTFFINHDGSLLLLKVNALRLPDLLGKDPEIIVVVSSMAPDHAIFKNIRIEEKLLLGRVVSSSLETTNLFKLLYL